LAGAVTGGCYSARRNGIAGRMARLIGAELGRLVLHCRVEGAAVCSEDFLDTSYRAAGDVGDFCMGGRRKGAEDESISSVAESDAV